LAVRFTLGYFCDCAATAARCLGPSRAGLRCAAPGVFPLSFGALRCVGPLRVVEAAGQGAERGSQEAAFMPRHRQDDDSPRSKRPPLQLGASEMTHGLEMAMEATPSMNDGLLPGVPADSANSFLYTTFSGAVGAGSPQRLGSMRRPYSPDRERPYSPDRERVYPADLLPRKRAPSIWQETGLLAEDLDEKIEGEEPDSGAVGPVSRLAVEENTRRLLECCSGFVFDTYTFSITPMEELAQRAKDQAEAQIKHFGVDNCDIEVVATHDGQIGHSSWLWMRTKEEDCSELLSPQEVQMQVVALREGLQQLKEVELQMQSVMDEQEPIVKTDAFSQAMSFGVTSAIDEEAPMTSPQASCFRASDLLELKKRAAQEEVQTCINTLFMESENFMREVINRVQFNFHYKSRPHTGRAVHIAVLSNDQEAKQLLGLVLELDKSSLDKRAPNINHGSKAVTFPIILAAGCGHTGMLKTLLECRADANQKSKICLMAEVKRAKSEVLDHFAHHHHAHSSGDLSAESSAPAEQGFWNPGIFDWAAPGKYDRAATVPLDPLHHLVECDHYTALHEAAFFKQVEPCRALIEGRANVDERNLDSYTPLHIAAKGGADQVVKILVQGQADLSLRVEKSNFSALELAIDQGNFPIRKMHLLTQKCIEDLVAVAKQSPAAAAELMRDPDDDSGSTVHISWRTALSAQAADMPELCQQWRELMRIAPQAGEDLLEALTVAPEETDKPYHPLPKHAMIRQNELLRAHYEDVWLWKYDSSNKHPTPEWHCHPYRGLAPQARRHEGRGAVFRDSSEVMKRTIKERRLCWGISKVLKKVHEINFWASDHWLQTTEGRKTSTRVNVKVLKISGMLCPEVLVVLKDTRHLHIFTKIATRAIIDVVWKKCVSHFYYAHFVYRCLEIAVLSWWVLYPPEDEFQARLGWSFLFASVLREVLYEVLEIRGFFRLMIYGEFGSKHAFLRFFTHWISLGNLFDVLSIILLLALVILSYDANGTERMSVVGFHAYKELMAGVVLTRWVQLMVACRAFSAIGQKLLPILQSTISMGGIFCVTIFCFLGFLHAFLALGSRGASTREILVNTVRFLLVGDGDGIDMVLSLGKEGDDASPPSIECVAILVVAVFIFVIWIMNLFIAGTDQAYEQALEFAMARFQQERASICLQCLFRPSVPYKWKIKGYWLRLIQVFILVPIYFNLLGMDEVPLLLTSVWLCVTIIMLEAMVLQPPSHWAERAAYRQHDEAIQLLKQSHMSSEKSGVYRQNSPGTCLSSRSGLETKGSFGGRQISEEHVALKSALHAETTPADVEQAEDGIARSLSGASCFEDVPWPRWAEAPSGRPTKPALPLTTEEQPVPPQEAPPQISVVMDPGSGSPSAGSPPASPWATDAPEVQPASRRGCFGLKELPRMFLWICHREDYDEQDFWPSGDAGTESMDRMEGRVASMKRDGMLRSKRQTQQLFALKQKTEQLQYSVHKSMKSVHSQMRRVESSVETRLGRIEELLLGLHAAGGLGGAAGTTTADGLEGSGGSGGSGGGGAGSGGGGGGGGVGLGGACLGASMASRRGVSRRRSSIRLEATPEGGLANPETRPVRELHRMSMPG